MPTPSDTTIWPSVAPLVFLMPLAPTLSVLKNVKSMEAIINFLRDELPQTEMKTMMNVCVPKAFGIICAQRSAVAQRLSINIVIRRSWVRYPAMICLVKHCEGLKKIEAEMFLRQCRCMEETETLD
ncbi:uncharacterized protein LOC135493655 [Lineus longissimus]|uniref:uncharacterized protein LOC135493655 n=1 Tax=Lineus longissimus TaxID=88925 RepID=UPI00315C51BA